MSKETHVSENITPEPENTPETLETGAGEGEATSKVPEAPEASQDAPDGAAETEPPTGEPAEEGEEAEGESGEEDPGGERTANREAAKYRRRLREVEAERDALQDRLNTVNENVLDHIFANWMTVPYYKPEGHQHSWRQEPDGQGGYRDAVGIAVLKLKHPEDIFALAGKTVNDFLSGDGVPDMDVIAETLAQVAKARPELFNFQHRGSAGPMPSIGQRPDIKELTPTWGKVLGSQKTQKL